jgi:hypothetical protein
MIAYVLIGLGVYLEQLTKSVDGWHVQIIRLPVYVIGWPYRLYLNRKAKKNNVVELKVV